jgi:hypothetical protein
VAVGAKPATSAVAVTPPPPPTHATTPPAHTAAGVDPFGGGSH